MWDLEGYVIRDPIAAQIIRWGDQLKPVQVLTMYIMDREKLGKIIVGLPMFSLWRCWSVAIYL